MDDEREIGVAEESWERRENNAASGNDGKKVRVS